ncbi:low molecular weight protein-tyrosine-phosphatase [Pseudoalteromonas sp. T1lg88]|uniref:low molecular weight protein-tyrosine-phosphatase n=1 Tax=Pseudoalteromonas sp. T1lg88 TaxID=2077104 RepID=UPI000CF72687|nr:low molecular weight protein-tyrosine-phosphatase [Pseudoalteromonas sp. T1lg88]
MFDSVLMVCAGNICRSPKAEYLLKRKVAAANKAIHISSAGLTAMKGHDADHTAQSVAAEQGVDMTPHKGRQICGELVASHSVILVMEESHLRDLHQRYPHARGKAFLLGKWMNNQPIPDPYKQSREAFEHVYQLIDQATNAWLKYL